MPQKKTNPWIAHVMLTKSKLPAGTKFKDVLVKASQTFTKKK